MHVLVHTNHKASAHPTEKATDRDSPSSRRQADVRSIHYQLSARILCEISLQ